MQFYFIYFNEVPRSLGACGTSSSSNTESRVRKTVVGMGRRTGHKYIATTKIIYYCSTWKDLCCYSTPGAGLGLDSDTLEDTFVPNYWP